MPLPTDPKSIARALLWLAALGAVVLVGSRVVAKTAGKAGSALH